MAKTTRSAVTMAAFLAVFSILIIAPGTAQGGGFRVELNGNFAPGEDARTAAKARRKELEADRGEKTPKAKTTKGGEDPGETNLLVPAVQ